MLELPTTVRERQGFSRPSVPLWHESTRLVRLQAVQALTITVNNQGHLQVRTWTSHNLTVESNLLVHLHIPKDNGNNGNEHDNQGSISSGRVVLLLGIGRHFWQCRRNQFKFYNEINCEL